MIFLFRIPWLTLVLLIYVAIMSVAHYCGYNVARAATEPLPPASERTVAWYEHHPDFANRVLAACWANPGHSGNSGDCQNVKRAELPPVRKARR